MNIGDKLTGKHTYLIEKRLFAEDRPNANIYLCVDGNGGRYIAKHFYQQRPMPNVGYGKENHFGRRRDGSRQVFDEIERASRSHHFLIRHFDRLKYKGKWVIIIQYIDGPTLTRYIEDNKLNILKVNRAVIALAETLSTWHRHGFAHGDPHLDNCVIQFNELDEPKISLIDYCQLHHENFKYCQKYDCFTTNKNRRIKEDLINPQPHFGRGFKKELMNLEIKHGYGNSLSELFDLHYTK